MKNSPLLLKKEVQAQMKMNWLLSGQLEKPSINITKSQKQSMERECSSSNSLMKNWGKLQATSENLLIWISGRETQKTIGPIFTCAELTFDTAVGAPEVQSHHSHCMQCPQ
ncbi:unnamed protein product [Caretta caretta]